MMQSQLLSPWSLLTASGALLAFLVGLYTLVGRERKSPYLINSVFSTFFICITGIVFDLASILIISYKDILLIIGTVFLLAAIVQTLWQLNKLAARFSSYVDSARPKYWWAYRKTKELKRRFSDRTPYEYNPSRISEAFRKEIGEILKTLGLNSSAKFEDHDDFDYRSAAVKLRHQGQANSVLTALAKVFLKQNYPVQYLTASRHPLEFISFLKKEIDKDESMSWITVAERVVVIDAYTPHFGFIDSIYSKATQKLISEYSVMYVTSGKSYAGLHTAASIAFNKIKDKTKGDVRHPVLIIYEDCYALVDLESTEQYRVFVRHVLPSERLWDGMFTVFAETAQDDHDWKLLCSYVSATLDLSVDESEKIGTLVKTNGR